MKIGIVVINWNGLELLKKYLKVLIQNSVDHNIYLVDNNSEDENLSIIEKEEFSAEESESSEIDDEFNLSISKFLWACFSAQTFSLYLFLKTLIRFSTSVVLPDPLHPAIPIVFFNVITFVTCFNYLIIQKLKLLKNLIY